MTDWFPSTKPYRTGPPQGAAGIVLPIRNDLHFFKLCFHSLMSFTDYRFMLTIVDSDSTMKTWQYLESLRRNHTVNVLQYQKPHNLAGEWNLGLRFMFSFANVRYGVVMTPTVVVEPNWLSTLIRCLETNKDAAAITPISNGAPDELVAFKRDPWEAAGGFDESRVEPTAYLAKLIEENGLRCPMSGEVYVHKFKRNGFETSREERDLVEQREAQHVRA